MRAADAIDDATATARLAALQGAADDLNGIENVAVGMGPLDHHRVAVPADADHAEPDDMVAAAGDAQRRSSEAVGIDRAQT